MYTYVSAAYYGLWLPGNITFVFVKYVLVLQLVPYASILVSVIW